MIKALIFYLIGFVILRFWYSAAMYSLGHGKKSWKQTHAVSKANNIFEWYFVYNVVRTSKQNKNLINVYYALNIINHILVFLSSVLVLYTNILMKYKNYILISLLVIIFVEMIFMFITTVIADPKAYKQQSAIRKKKQQDIR